MPKSPLGGDGGADRIGIESSMMLAEANPVWAFVGIYLSEPLLQGGILVSVFGYMVYLQPPMALAAFVVFAPQFVFIPLMLAAINRRVKMRIATMREVAARSSRLSPRSTFRRTGNGSSAGSSASSASTWASSNSSSR